MAGNLTAMIAAIYGISAAIPDPYFEYTTLLLPGNGTNGAQNNTFLDGSTNNFTITRNGNTTQGTFSPFSQTGWGNYLPTTSERLTTASSSSDFSFGTGNFTVEGFVNLSSASNCMVFQMSTAATGYNASNTNSVCFYIGGGVNAGKLEIYANNAAFASTNVLVTSSDIGKWYHFAIVRSSGSTTVYWNGSAVAGLTSIADSANYTMTYCVIGTVYNNSYSLQGYLSNFRVLKGTAQYSGSSLTVPTAPFATGTTNQVLLTCQANRFVDSNTATTAKTITVSGSPTVVAFSPFNPTASWSAATYGGSGYFDGNGDKLTVAANTAFQFGTGDFCIEFWIYPVSLSSYQTPIDMGYNGAGSYVVQTGNGNGIPVFYTAGSVLITSSTAWTANSFNHVAVCRSGTTLSMFLNGLRTATVSNSTNFNSNGTLGIGASATASPDYPINGYMSNVRLVKGSSVYDPTQTSITVPTAPLTAITNTSLLLNFTNAGIYDATSKNDLETVGNAQISTAISAKWGSGTIALDGNGDYLNFPSSQLNVFGTGDFTIEMWAYITDYTTGSPTFNDYGSFFDFRTANTSQVNVVLSFLSTFGGTGRPCMFINGAVTITGNVMTTNSWTHIALSRVSGVTRMYMGGDQAGSNYTDTNNYTSTVCTIGVNIARDAFLKGYIQDPRITRGYGRYVTGTGGNAGKMVLNGTNTLALPTAAFPTL